MTLKNDKMMNKLLVSDIMTREPLTAKPDARLLDCVRKMVSKRIGSILLVQDKRLVGLISNKDVMWAISKKDVKDLREVKAIDVSPRKLATIKPNVSVKIAWEKMKKLKFERLPVIHNGELVGLITIKDILNFNPEVYSELEEIEKIKEQSAKLKRVRSRDLNSVVQGICEECGNPDILQNFNGMMICESCANSM